MISCETNVRVRYAETDKMGYVYYGRYLEYYEIGRTELIRNMGVAYRQMEESGVLLPVINVNINYLKAAVYDDLITIKTSLKQLPGVRIKFDYEIFNEQNDLLNSGEATLLFLNDKTRKPIKCPGLLMDVLKPHFS